MSHLEEAVKAGRFVVTGEIGPPKGIDTKDLMREVEELRGKVVAINVTDNQSSVMRLGSMAVCSKLLGMGIEPVYQITCRDRNRIALQSDLLSAAYLGIENVLCLTGDHVSLGDHPGAKPVFDLDSVNLLRSATGLEAGEDLVGGKVVGTPKFFKGCVVTPCTDLMELQLLKLEKKLEAGAQFVQTQAVYEPKVFESFMSEVRKRGIKAPIFLGLVVLKSAAMAKFMNENVAGVTVPEPLVAEMAATPKEARKAKSAEIGARLLKAMAPMCQGAHLMTLGWTDIVGNILEQAGVKSV
jgi:methylenetetrahydrofolate reductase (NADPH)